MSDTEETIVLRLSLQEAFALSRLSDLALEPLNSNARLRQKFKRAYDMGAAVSASFRVAGILLAKEEA